MANHVYLVYWGNALYIKLLTVYLIMGYFWSTDTQGIIEYCLILGTKHCLQWVCGQHVINSEYSGDQSEG